jgi:hypothetical protein
MGDDGRVACDVAAKWAGLVSDGVIRVYLVMFARLMRGLKYESRGSLFVVVLIVR